MANSSVKHQKLIIGVFNCPRFRFRVKGIKNSWLPHLPPSARVLFVYGRPGEASSIEGDKLFLDCPEAYERLPQKTHEFLKFCINELEFDYVFKTDDDSFIDLDRFLELDLEKADYIGQFKETPLAEHGKTWHYGKCTDKSFEVPYDKPFVCGWATGGGYFLSRKGAGIAVEKTARTYSDSLYEDMMIGEALTIDPRIRSLKTSFIEIGLINPLAYYDMKYIQDLLTERKELRQRLAKLKSELEAGSQE